MKCLTLIQLCWEKVTKKSIFVLKILNLGTWRVKNEWQLTCWITVYFLYYTISPDWLLLCVAVGEEWNLIISKRNLFYDFYVVWGKFITAHQRSCGKVMFSVVSVCSRRVGEGPIMQWTSPYSPPPRTWDLTHHIRASSDMEPHCTAPPDMRHHCTWSLPQTWDPIVQPPPTSDSPSTGPLRHETSLYRSSWTWDPLYKASKNWHLVAMVWRMGYGQYASYWNAFLCNSIYSQL